MASKATRPKNALAHGLYTELTSCWLGKTNKISSISQVHPPGAQPGREIQDIAVLDIARLHWVKRRLNVGAQLAYHRHPDAPAITEAGKEGWQGVRNYLRNKAGDTDTVATHITGLPKNNWPR